MSENKTNISAGTIARTIVLALALVNQILTATGHAVLPITDEQVNTLVSTIWTVVAACVAWWKNQSFTINAREADLYLQDLKAGREPGGSKGVLEEQASQKGEVEDVSEK